MNEDSSDFNLRWVLGKAIWYYTSGYDKYYEYIFETD